MVISRFEIDNVTFINLHAEQAFEGSFGSFLNKDIQQPGIFQDTLTKTTIDKLERNIDLKPILTDNVLFDFQNIELLQVNQNINFTELLSKLHSKNILLLNIKNEIVSSLGYIDSIIPGRDFQDINIKNNQSIFPLLNTKQAFESYFHQIILKYLDDNLKLHKSSPVYINKYIDLKKFITNDQKFFVYSLYFLSLEMIKNKSNRKWVIKSGENDIILFSQNMNGSFIASILSHFLQLNVILIDHVGPINKIYSSFKNRIDRNKKYLIVADVVCLETEVRIAKNIIEFSGGEYLGNVSVVRVNTLKPEDKKYDDVETIYLIEKGNNKIGYSIKTALDF